jgi:hypothetical protein
MTMSAWMKYGERLSTISGSLSDAVIALRQER